MEEMNNIKEKLHHPNRIHPASLFRYIIKLI